MHDVCRDGEYQIRSIRVVDTLAIKLSDMLLPSLAPDPSV